MHWPRSILASMTVLAVTTACAPTFATEVLAAEGLPENGSAVAEVDPRLAASQAKFGSELIGLLAADETDGNVVISPLSVHTALSMTYNGAGGTTAAEMATALSLGDLTLAELDQAYADLLTRLHEKDDLTLTVANSLWADSAIVFEQGFIDANRDYFGAGLRTLDLDAPDSIDAINHWVSERTNDRIPEIVDADMLDRDSIMVLLNAVYFDAEWTFPFETDATRPSDFTLASGDTASVDMMWQSTALDYLDTASVTGVRLPYGSGQTAMYVFLPVQGTSPGEFLAGLDGSEWERLLDSFQTGEVDLGLPRFETRLDVELDSALEALGMAGAFTPFADFTPMTLEPQVGIDTVRHVTYIRVDEAGTEAAAATAVEMATLSAIGTPAWQFVADRPFAFAIRDDVTGAVLFMGVINDPRA